MSNFVSVTTTAARYQELSPNPQKLAGQCCKLKCCLNYEVDSYIDERKDFPPSEAIMTTNGKAYHQKTDVFRRLMWYSVGDANSLDMIPVSVEKVKEYLEMNKRGIKVELEAQTDSDNSNAPEEIDFTQVVGQDSLTRFDSSRRKKKKHRNRQNRGNNQQDSNRGGNNAGNNETNA